MGNKLRILYSNVADTATITATTTATNFATANMQNDIKGSVWRSTSLLSNTITLNWSSAQSINCVVLPFTNLSKTATINVSAYNAVNGTGTLLYTSNTINAIPYTIPSWDTTYTGTNAYSYGGGTSTVVYFPSTLTSVISLTITLFDNANTQGYVEVSRILCGQYWSPAFNADFGITLDYVDQSSHSRAQSGNIITDIGPVHKTLSFSLNFMSTSDRNYLVQIMKLNGMRKPLFVSIFPNDTDAEKEYNYQIYGKLSSNPTITHPMYTIYTSTLTIEEV